MTLAIALCAAAFSVSCQRSSTCTAPQDVSGVWRGDARDSLGNRAQVELRLTQSGSNVGGTYAIANGWSGALHGLRIAARVEFETEPAAECGKRLHGVAQFCGESIDFRLDGETCLGELHARGTLQRAAGTPAAGGSGSTGTGSGRAGSGPVANAGRGSIGPGGTGTGGTDQTSPPCALMWLKNGRCDEPEGTGLCPEGTDVDDCTRSVRPCAYTNDGQCDEPEGTGLCDEGQDPADCHELVWCGMAACTFPPSLSLLPGDFARACCVAGECGLMVGAGICFEITPGVQDASCTQALSSYVATGVLQGCCRPDGFCGISSANSDLGCVLPESVGPPISGAGRIPCGGPDDGSDAGAF